MSAIASNHIKAIDKESVHRICSGQVVLDMATAVKELLENSLDAGATSIVVKFKQSGLDYITVTDNGCGITDADLETLALKHYTSKLTSFNELAQVRSFGFRGEALSSLCALANLTVTTSTGHKPTGVLVEYTSDGTVKSKTPTPMTKGTIVRISNLFEGMPVRRNEFVKNIKREYTKCIGLIQAYALIATNVRISCVSQTDKKPAMTYIATSGNATIRQNIINVFGPKSMIDVIDFELEIVQGNTDMSNRDKEHSIDEEEEHDHGGGIVLTGHISSPSFGKGRSSGDRQYLFINGRPCVLPKISRVINEVYHSFNTNQSPFLVANLILPTSYYDVNVSPDKRTIFLHNERMIVEELRNKLTELFEPSRSTFAVSEARLLIKKPDLSTRLNSGYPNGDDGAINVGDEGATTNRKDPGTINIVQDVIMEIPPSEETPVVSVVALKPTFSSIHSSLKATVETVTTLGQTKLTDKALPLLVDGALKRKTRSNFSDSENETEPDEDKRPGLAENNVRIDVEQKVDATESSPMDTKALFSSSKTLSANTSVQSDSTLYVMEGYDPLDDKIREDQEMSASDSDEEQACEPQKQRRTTMQHVVILDSEVHQDGDRDCMEVAFNVGEHRKTRVHRMEVVRESRRLEQNRTAQRLEKTQKKALERQQGLEIDRVGESFGENEDKDADKDADQPLNVRRSRRLRSLKLSDASFANMDDLKARKSLSRVISKGDFARMKILGQFNKAFIVARLDNYAEVCDPHITTDEAGSHRPRLRQKGRLISSDIFVIDQHASDEKYNFETLQAKTVFSTQRLFQPKKLHLTAQEEITVVDHMKMLNKNGFYLDYSPEAPVSHRLRLVTLPVSESVVFDLQDFEELVFLLSQQTASSIGDAYDTSAKEEVGLDQHQRTLQQPGSSPEKVVRCSKVRTLFASRACRRSVMIGHVLNHSQMKRIVRHMGEIDQPWNCPHGRPTMRHLLDLTELEQQERPRQGEGWDGEEDFEDDDMEDEERRTNGLAMDRSGGFDPIALKRPTRHQGSLFKQFMAIPVPHVAL
ncbi:hypothetical protein BGX28_002097 [Mortierella sp. GBA30]|nr:hypothetical protein BGX28_002097 [Mortierella sp. GBA30]